MTFIAALRHDRLTAPMLLDGPMTGQSFIAYVEQMLAPTLKRGDILVMDNVPTHRVRGVREAVAIRGVNVPEFPPYSPDLNPIEQSFAKLKALLRKAGARSPRQISTAIASALKHFSAAECAAYLAHDAMVNLIGKCSSWNICRSAASATRSGKSGPPPAVDGVASAGCHAGCGQASSTGSYSYGLPAAPVRHRRFPIIRLETVLRWYRSGFRLPPRPGATFRPLRRPSA